ncbi:DNA repair protein XRCC4 isoform X1 [Hydra vulgaris]|uniref:DNA repair protein XRCC4 isoform X1 n=2 Tax=Hydra vulgaris TaxID=6087 RepID=UPI001F5EBF85|nr:DNA repair protein XRCC4 isoform X1 [Hydra vulgaris]
MNLNKVLINNQTYFIFSSFKSGINLRLTNGWEVYNGNVSEHQLSLMANRIDMCPLTFLQSIKDAFCNNSLSELFSFDLNKMENSCELVWKKILSDETKFQLASLTLQKDNHSAPILSLLEGAMETVQMLSRSVTKLEKDNMLLEKETNTLTKRMENYVQTKDELEQQLFSKFCLVLNEKKARIRYLKNELEQKTWKSNQSIENKAAKSAELESIDIYDIKRKKIDLDASHIVSRENDSINILNKSIEPESFDVPKSSRRKIRSSKIGKPVAMQQSLASTSKVSEEYSADNLLNDLF